MQNAVDSESRTVRHEQQAKKGGRLEIRGYDIDAARCKVPRAEIKGREAKGEGAAGGVGGSREELDPTRRGGSHT